MATDKNILKGWFSNYKKPTQEQFWAWLESYWHKGEKIPVSELEGLNELLAAVQTPIVTDTYLIQVSLQGNKLRLVMSNEQVFEVDLSAVVGSGGGGITSVQWNDIEDKPPTFTPATHTHPISQVNGLQGVLDNKANTNHTHTIQQVTGLQTALNGKADTNHTHVVNWNDIQGKPTNLGGGGVPAQHTHVIADVTNLQTELNNKANVNHNHNWNDIQNKPNDFTPSTHTHVISDVTNLQQTLNNKADVNHTHVVNWSDIQGKPSTFPSDTVQWSDIQNKPSAYPPSSHNHNISQITGLQQALNGKADVNHIHTLEPLEITTTTQLNATHNNRILMVKGNISLTLSEGGSAGFTGCGIDVVEGRVLFGVGQNMTLTGFSANELNKDEKAYLYRMKPNEHNFRLV